MGKTAKSEVIRLALTEYLVMMNVTGKISQNEKWIINYTTVKENYDRNFWTKTMVKDAVKKGVITREQYEEITNEPYTKANLFYAPNV